MFRKRWSVQKRHPSSLAVRVSLAGAIAISMSVSSAEAAGTMRIQRRDGSVSNYANIGFRIARHTLRVISADRQGVLTIALVGCVKVGELHRCEPGGAEYRQNGEVRALAVTGGTLYFNATHAEQHLSGSSMGVPPRGVILAFHTARETYFSGIARIDGLKNDVKVGAAR